jgi:hypothetical protein
VQQRGNHILRCEGGIIFRKRGLRNSGADIGIGRRVGCNIRGQRERIGIYTIKYKEKQERMVRKHEREAKTKSDDQ